MLIKLLSNSMLVKLTFVQLVNLKGKLIWKLVLELLVKLSLNIVSILTALFKKKAYHNLDYGFNENYNIIGDLDLFFRMSKNNIIEYIDEPLAVYRLHKSNYSKLNKNEEINELREWYKNIFLKISNNQNEINIIKNAILLREIIFMILNQKRIKSITKILLYKNSILKLKLVMAILIPNFILKKYLKF